MIENLNNKNMYTTKTTTMDKSLDMMSLYDYLGHAAGSNLGKEVARVASRQKVQIETRHVSNKKYTGPVLLYPKYFLDKYFGTKQEKLLF